MRTAAPSGFALLEAMIALLLMSVGMLALARLQLGLHATSDLSRQRTEASHLAQQKLEQLRSFEQRDATPGASSFATLASGADQPALTANTTFARTWTMAPFPAASNPYTTATVALEWPQRSGATARLQLSSLIARADPADAGLLRLHTNAAEPMFHPRGRHPAIPPGAEWLDSKFSALRWAARHLLLDNKSGEVVALCTTLEGRMRADSPDCTPVAAYLLSGTIDGNGWPSVPGLQFDQVEHMAGAPECHVDAANPSSPGSTKRIYTCLVQPADHDGNPHTAKVWSGRVRIVGPPGATAICRHSPNADSTVNAEHPERYRLVEESLDNQDYVLDFTGHCPEGSVLHQPP